MSKALDEIRQQMVGMTVCKDTTEGYGFNLSGEDTDQILSLKTTNGYTIKEMIEFFSKINRETEREAVVEKEGELPENPYAEYRCTDARQATWKDIYKYAQQDMLDAGYKRVVEEVKK